MDILFKGEVNTSIIKKAFLNNDNNELLIDLYNKIDDFRDFWLNGFSPNIGKDIKTFKPDIEGHRHVHIYPNKEDLKQLKRKSKKNWENWRTKPNVFYHERNSFDIPSSNTGFFYFVCTNRIAYLFHYCDEHLHEFMKTQEFYMIVDKISNLLLSKGIEFMNTEEQQCLFEEKWYL